MREENVYFEKRLLEWCVMVLKKKIEESRGEHEMNYTWKEDMGSKGWFIEWIKGIWNIMNWIGKKGIKKEQGEYKN